MTRNNLYIKLYNVDCCIFKKSLGMRTLLFLYNLIIICWSLFSRNILQYQNMTRNMFNFEDWETDAVYWFVYKYKGPASIFSTDKILYWPAWLYYWQGLLKWVLEDIVKISYEFSMKERQRGIGLAIYLIMWAPKIVKN